MSKTIVIGFDFDQTLADSDIGIQDCLKYTGGIYGVEVEMESLARIAKSGLKLEPMLREFIPESFLPQARNTFLSIYPELGVAGTKPIEGASHLMQMLRSNGHRLVVVSAKNLQNLELSLKHLHFEFDEVYGGASGPEKTRCIIRSKIQIYVGDQESDVIAAHDAGVMAILVSHNPPTFDLQKYECHHFENLPLLAHSITKLIELQGAQ
jgi:hypothetical protein